MAYQAVVRVYLDPLAVIDWVLHLVLLLLRIVALLYGRLRRRDPTFSRSELHSPLPTK